MLCLGNSGVTSYDMVQGITLEKDAVLDEFCREKWEQSLITAPTATAASFFPEKTGPSMWHTAEGCTVMWKRQCHGAAH